MNLGGKPELSPRLVASLDAARASAACYVVLHHLANAHHWAMGLGLVFRFGQEAVLVFFLLSGFVIFANERERAVRPGGYYLRRIRRIYPALIMAIVASTLVAFDNGTLASAFKWRELIGTLASVQDVSLLKPGVIVDPYLDNNPLWSLSYEMAFYLVFPLALILWRQWPLSTNHAIGLICCAAYVSYVALPNHWSLVGSYFLVWWAGAMAADAYFKGGRDFRAMGSPFYWLLTLCVIALGSVFAIGFRGLGLYPFLMLRHFAVAMLLLALLFGPFGALLASASARLAKPAAFLASISYGLYVLHYPLLVSWWRASNDVGLALALALLIMAALLADRQLNRWLPRAPTA
jgi:peptidoglycan/LPS O-acetylase OafA/YrhL